MKEENHVIRLKVPLKGHIEYKDQVRGKLKFDLSLIEDQILIKSDGYPTYHFANVIDDHKMKISHVIRGEEWLSSCPIHVLLYRLLGWDLPKFIHLPLLLNSDKSKLSKRLGDVAVESYLEKGFLPSALINFVSLLGWHPPGDDEIFSMNSVLQLIHFEKSHKLFLAMCDLHK